MATDRKTRRGREYLRVSYDKSGDERSQDEQHDENAAAAKALGVTLGQPYRENGSTSASRYCGKVRGEWADLLDDLRRDRFNGDVLVLWEHSRGSRQVGEWVDLIDLCEARDVGIFVTTHGREYDPANARDRRTLLEDAIDSAYESDKVSVRVKRSAASNAARGRPSGVTPYGFRRRYDPVTRKLVAQEPYEPEAVVVRELFDRLLKGHSLRSIARDFETRGVRTPRSGKVFSSAHLRDMAMRPAYAGLRTHHPRSRGEPTGNSQRRSIDGAIDAIWDGLVPKETYYAVRRLLTRPERKTTRPGRARHLLSMIARCGECGGPLAATTRRGQGREAAMYQCHHKGCTRVGEAELDDLATEAILRWLARPDVLDAIGAADTDNADLAEVRGRLGLARAELDEASGAVPEDVEHARMLASLVTAKRGAVTALEEREREMTAPSSLRDLIAPGKQAARRWKAIPMSAKREVARMLLAPSMLGELRVMRRPEGRRNTYVPAVERVEWSRS